MFIESLKNFQVDYYIDIGFVGIFGEKNGQDPTCVKSRTGYLIEFMDFSW